MRRIIAILLVLTLIPVSHGQTNTATTVEFYKDHGSSGVDNTQGGTYFVDLLDDKGKMVRLETVDNKADQSKHAFPPTFTAAAVTYTLSCTCGDSIELAGARSGTKWVATLPVNERDFLVGSWSVTVTGVPSSGAVEVLGPHTLLATANDVAAPIVTAQGMDATTKTVDVGRDQAVVLEITEPLLRKVTYQLDGFPKPLELSFPYALGIASFREGEQSVRFVAEDRAGHATELLLTVYADDVSPVVNITVPQTLYHNVPNPLAYKVTEISNFTVTAFMGNATGSADGDGGAAVESGVVSITPEELGNETLQLVFRDRLGNTFTLNAPVVVVPLEADVVLHDGEVKAHHSIIGEPITMTVEASVGISPVPVDADVYFRGIRIGNMTIDDEGKTTSDISFTFAGGKHIGLLELRTDPNVVEMNVTNQNMSVEFEVFIGRVTYGRAHFEIRGTELGQPIEAVDAQGKTYPVTVQDRDLGLVYAFTVADVNLHWDPMDLVTVIPVETEGSGEPDNGIPSVGLLGLLGAIAVGFIARRK